uniref:GP-PDE domain-containing protein n=1 Tax=Pseudictyota dubia TaxID=2749911 RepID=A0A7R9VFC3_9STRA
MRSSHNLPPRLPSSPRHARGQNHHHPPPPRPPRPGMPHLLLLTVSDPPQKECELELNVADAASRGSRVDSWVHSSDGSLHGLYLQFQKEMLEPDGLRGIRDLTDRGYLVGVWGHNGRDPDDYRTFHRLVREAGVSFVNSDLPRRFKMGEPSAHRGVSFGL